jgi:hypothetical protein
VELTPPSKIVEAITFDTVNPAFKGEMIMEATFEAEIKDVTLFELIFMGEVGVVFAQKRARLFPLLLYHLLSTRTLPFWAIFFGVLSPILRRKRRASFAPAVKALL